MDFQDQMCCRENLTSERNVLQCQLREKSEYLASIQLEQANDFHALICKHDVLCREYNTLQKELKVSQEEHDHLCDENHQLDEKLDEHCKTIEQLKCIQKTHLEIAESLKNENCNKAQIRNKLQNDLQVAESEQKDVVRTMIDVQNKLAEKINEHAELEKTVNTEENQSEHLVSTIDELRIRIEKLKKSSQTEDAEQKKQLNNKLVALAVVEQNIHNKRGEIEFHKNRSTEFNVKIKTLQKDRTEKKCKFDMDVCALQTENNTMTSKLATRSAKLCELQNVITALKDHLKDQDVVIESLKSTNERAREKVDRIKQATDSIKNNIATVQGQREKMKENYTMELASKIQGKQKLEMIVKNQLKQITELQKQMFDQHIGKSLR